MFQVDKFGSSGEKFISCLASLLCLKTRYINTLNIGYFTKNYNFAFVFHSSLKMYLVEVFPPAAGSLLGQVPWVWGSLLDHCASRGCDHSSRLCLCWLKILPRLSSRTHCMCVYVCVCHFIGLIYIYSPIVLILGKGTKYQHSAFNLTSKSIFIAILLKQEFQCLPSRYFVM